MLDLGNKWMVYLDFNEAEPLSSVYLSGPSIRKQAVYKLVVPPTFPSSGESAERLELYTVDVKPGMASCFSSMGTHFADINPADGTNNILKLTPTNSEESLEFTLPDLRPVDGFFCKPVYL